MAGAGNNLIVDEVIFGNVTTEHGNVLSEYRMLLAPFQLYFVGVHAPLDILEDRERRRGDRLIGLARWQHGRVHKGMVYDLEIDTELATAAESARTIKERFGL
jgi:chloramphenicol 3-O phosphotransferase